MFSHQIDPETELRLLEERHAAELFALTDKNRDYLREWLPWLDGTSSVGDTTAFINGTLQKFAENGAVSTGIWHRNKLVGVIGLHHVDWVNSSTSIGYWLDESHQGRGLVTRACEALVNYAFSELELHRIEIQAASENARSQAVPKRLGFTREGVLRQAANLYGRRQDLVVYGMLADEWRLKTD